MADDSDAVRWLSYVEIASAFGIARESARQLVIRKRWPRRKGNDGKARIGVPLAALPPERTSAHTSEAPSHVTADNGSSDPSEHVRVSELLARLEETQRRLGAAEAVVPALRETVELLKAALASEKERTADWRAERDRLSARRSWWPWRRAG